MSVIPNQKKNRQLKLGAKRGKWRTNPGAESGDKEFAEIKPKVLDRDRCTCVYCGTSVKGMQVHHRNDNHEDNYPENLETVCEMCHAPNHLGFMGKAGVIVYLPVLSQIEVSHLFRTIAVAISYGGEIGEKAKKLATIMIDRYRIPIDQVFGTDNPADFGNALIALSDSDYESRYIALRDVRVLFKPEKLSTFATKCRESIYANLPPSLWQRIYDDAMETI